MKNILKKTVIATAILATMTACEPFQDPSTSTPKSSEDSLKTQKLSAIETDITESDKSLVDASVSPFRATGKIVRYIVVHDHIDILTHDHTNIIKTYLHADNMLETDTFKRVRGMAKTTFRVNNVDSVTMLAGSNDSSLTESFAQQYLTCVSDAANQWIHRDNFGFDGCDVNQDGVVDNANGTVKSDDRFLLGDSFAYYLLNKSNHNETDEWYRGSEFKGGVPIEAEKSSEVNEYVEDVTWSSDDRFNWFYNTTHGEFDATTGVYSEIIKEDLSDVKSANKGRKVIDKRAFFYEVPSVDADRYVNFNGIWEASQLCDDGHQAVKRMEFGSDIKLSGTECSGVAGDTALAHIREEGLNVSYAELGLLDFWWFSESTDGRKISEATLTELNSVVRYCDQGDYVAGSVCGSDDERFVKWEYTPVGANWDEGTLIRNQLGINGGEKGHKVILKKLIDD